MEEVLIRIHTLVGKDKAALDKRKVELIQQGCSYIDGRMLELDEPIYYYTLMEFQPPIASVR